MWGGGKQPAEIFLDTVKERGILNNITKALYMDILHSDNPEATLREHMQYIDLMTLPLKFLPTPFPLPPVEVGGEIWIGTSFNRLKIGFNLNELNTLIAGEPGTGKTILEIFIIARQAMRLGVKCWFFVKARDVEKLLLLFPDIIIPDLGDGLLRVNPLQAPPNVRQDDWLAKFWDIFIQAEGLYDGTGNFLLKYCNELFDAYSKTGFLPSLFELLAYIQELKFARNYRLLGYQDSAINRLEGILKSALGKMFDCSSGCLEKLVDKNVVFNIDSLPSTKQVLFTNYLTSWLFTYKKNNPFTYRNFLLNDDAMLLFDASFEKRPDRGTPIINHHLAEIRKAMINIIAAVQLPSLVGQGIFGTSSIKIFLACGDGKNSGHMLDSMGVHDARQRDYGMKLRKEDRIMIVRKGYGYTKPFDGVMVNVKDMDNLERSIVTPQMRKETCNRKDILEPIAERFSYPQFIALQDGISASNAPVREEIKDVKLLLEDIYNRPFVSSVARADYFHFNNEKAKKLYSYIESEKLADAVHINTTGRGGQTKFYWLTEKGCKAVGKERKPQGSGGKGSVHIFVQYYLSDFLMKGGFSGVEIEKYVDGKKIDLFCSKDGRSFAIEICISTFETEYLNVIKDRGKCNKVLIVCLDSKAKSEVIEKLRGLKEEVDVFTIAEFLKVQW